MEMLRRTADKYGLACLLHEKPFAGINGSGKHNNWSMSTDAGENLLNPGDTPHDNAQFLVFCVAVIRAVAQVPRAPARVGVGSPQRSPPGRQRGPAGHHLDFPGRPAAGRHGSARAGQRRRARSRAGSWRSASIVLPKLPRDAGDRNRTSPFAFTGNKFEFRAVGASQSIAGAEHGAQHHRRRVARLHRHQPGEGDRGRQGPQQGHSGPAARHPQGVQEGRLQRRQLFRGMAQGGREARPAEPAQHRRRPARYHSQGLDRTVHEIQGIQRAANCRAVMRSIARPTSRRSISKDS